MRLREWSAAETARRFVLHPNSVRHWLKQLRTTGKSSHLFTGPVWNRIHDAVRWTVHELRRLCPEPEVGTRTIARHIVRAAVQISRSSVQRILREERPKRRSVKPAIVPPEGVEPHHLLAPQTTNRVWQCIVRSLAPGDQRTPQSAGPLQITQESWPASLPRSPVTQANGRFASTITDQVTRRCVKQLRRCHRSAQKRSRLQAPSRFPSTCRAKPCQTVRFSTTVMTTTQAVHVRRKSFLIPKLATPRSLLRRCA